MIPKTDALNASDVSKPRASGDDPGAVMAR